MSVAWEKVSFTSVMSSNATKGDSHACIKMFEGDQRRLEIPFDRLFYEIQNLDGGDRMEC